METTRTTTTELRLIVGLGNPGPRYAETRHNAGFLVVDELARRWQAEFRHGKTAAEARHGQLRLLKPLSFMNLSGQVVQAYQTKLGLAPANLLVLHDDLDLPLGRLRLRRGGGAGGQKGVKDIIERLGTDFLRLKVGIGRPPEGWAVDAWVLSRFREDERALLAEVVRHAAAAVELLLDQGLERAMAHYNGLDVAAELARA